MNAPLIGAINGTAGGGGFSLMCACDILYLADTAKLTMAYTAAGLTPDASSTYFLPRMIGSQRALELALTNRRLTAGEALDWGLVNYVVPAADVLPEAQKLATQLASGPTLAYGATKKLMRISFNQALEAQMEDEAQSIVGITYTADAREGIDSFLNKRKPTFTGQ
jgi:2-(1,2-epoxy-1,2-dihydrophenyl)acetyl-CoA isomerase